MEGLRKRTLQTYRKLVKLALIRVPRVLLRERFLTEWRFYFKEARSLRLEADLLHLLETADLVKERLSVGVYPPFPSRVLSERSMYNYKPMTVHRKYTWNIWRNDIILEPGQDPPREPFYEPRQFTTVLLDQEEYFREVKTGKQFPEEAALFEHH
jgi:hypothetical protein